MLLRQPCPGPKIRAGHERGEVGGDQRGRASIGLAGVANRERLPVIPREPSGRMLRCLLGVAHQGVEIVQGVGGAEPTGVDQAHEQVAQPGAVLRLVAERVFPVEDGHLQGAFADIIIQGRARLAEEQGERFPVLDHIMEGLAQTGVGLDPLLLQLMVHPLLQLVHRLLTVLLVEAQPGFGRQVRRFGLGIILAL